MARLDKIRDSHAEKKCFGHAQGFTLAGSPNFFIKIDSDHPHAAVGDGYQISLNQREAKKLLRKLEQHVSETAEAE